MIDHCSFDSHSIQSIGHRIPEQREYVLTSVPFGSTLRVFLDRFSLMLLIFRLVLAILLLLPLYEPFRGPEFYTWCTGWLNGRLSPQASHPPFHWLHPTSRLMRIQATPGWGAVLSSVHGPFLPTEIDHKRSPDRSFIEPKFDFLLSLAGTSS